MNSVTTTLLPQTNNAEMTYHQMIQDIIAQRPSGFAYLMVMVGDDLKKIVNKRRDALVSLRMKPSDALCDLQADLYSHLAKNDFANLRKLDKDTSKDFAKYANRTAKCLLLKAIEREARHQGRETKATEGTDYADTAADNTLDRRLRLLENTIGHLLKGQQLRVMQALVENATQHRGLQQEELAAELGMTGGQFNKYKCEAKQRLKEAYGGRDLDQLEEMAARLRYHTTAFEEPAKSRL